LNRSQIHIVTSADSRFLRPLAVLLRSIERSNPDDAPAVTVLTDAAGARDGVEITSGLDVGWIGVPEGLGSDIELPSYLAAASLWRLAIPQLLPADLERVIYVDADTLVLKPLRPLWETDLGHCTVGAVRDPVVSWFGSPSGPPWDELGVSADSPYFNAGVMLIDLTAVRRDEVGERCMTRLRGQRLPHADQCALNVALVDAWHRLPPTWNLQCGHFETGGKVVSNIEPRADLQAAISSPSIVHFNTRAYGRPWLDGCTHPFLDAWLSTLDETTYIGWRPEAKVVPRRVLHRAVWHRLRGAASVLVRG